MSLRPSSLLKNASLFRLCERSEAIQPDLADYGARSPNFLPMGRIGNWIASSLSLLAKTVSVSFNSLLEHDAFSILLEIARSWLACGFRSSSVGRSAMNGSRLAEHALT
jgi:hypothetical protein